MRSLVTGGAGFIGSHLVEALVRAGDEVSVVDNLSTGRLENLRNVEGQVGFIQGSIMDPLLVDELVSGADRIFHLAAAVGVKLVVEQPLRSFLTNIRGTETVLEAAHRYGKKILIASTSEVYGKSEDAPFSEESDRVLGNLRISRWGYSISKAVDEILAFEYFRERGLPTVVVRLFNTTGPRQTGAYGMVLPRLVSQAMDGQPLTVYGDGSQTRCFCHVRDVVDALVRLMTEPAAEGDVFNVGSSEEVTILEVANRVVRITGSVSEIRLVPYVEAFGPGFEDMRRRVPDTSKIERVIGWSPRIDLEGILSELVAEARAHVPEGRSSG
jgi:UDP-glucose 4-epimerase